MAYTEHYNLFITNDGSESFINFRTQVAGETESNMTKIDAALNDADTKINNIHTMTPEAIVSVETGSTVSATDGTHTVSGTSVGGKCVLSLTNYGTWTFTATHGSTQFTPVTLEVTEVKQYIVRIGAKIYGAVWDGTSTTAWSRTDDAALFTNPVPYIHGSLSCSSPFDNIQPWSGMTKVTDSTAGTLVSIPKYWYKWTKNGKSLQLQISPTYQFDFFVSPAHADRGDGKGERDIVYVGRYPCSQSYKSMTGETPKGDITIDDARAAIHNLGQAYWQFDWAMYWTIAMLYLVEYAEWDSQKVIGAGGVTQDLSSVEQCGASDSMPYHTGTMKSPRTAYGVGCQYRWIEGLWENVLCFCDGIYSIDDDVYCINNPADSFDLTKGDVIGKKIKEYGIVTEFGVPQNPEYHYALIPIGVSRFFEEHEYTSDAFVNAWDGRRILCIGLQDSLQWVNGLFFWYWFEGRALQAVCIGCRLQKLP